MSNMEQILVKKFKLPGRDEEFLMHGDFVFRADNMHQAFYRDEDGNWVVIRKAFLTNPEWITILEQTYSQ